MKLLYLFDVDGVLCDRGQKIDPTFAAWFRQFIEGKQCCFITGSSREKTIQQLDHEIVDMCRISYHCMGNNIWIDNREISINQFVLKQEEVEFLEDLVRQHFFTKKTGSHIEYRKGSINFSIVGKNATLEERKLYSNFDKVFKDRLRIIKQIQTNFPRLEAYLGGEVSIDICLRGCNKSQILTFLMPHDKIYFFGDRCYQHGIDYPIAKFFTQTTIDTYNIHKDKFRWQYFQIDDGFRQTWDILKLL